MRRLGPLFSAAAAEREARRFTTDRDAPLLLLSAHFDDSVLSCWSLLESKAALTIVNVFGGAPAPGALSFWDRLTRADDGHTRARERREEDRAALAVAGREALALPLLENGYRQRASMAARRVLAALAEISPRAAGVVAPLGIGGHPDHLVVRQAAIALSRRGLPLGLYADIPYAARYGWPAWVTSEDPRPTLDPDVYWRQWLDGVPLRDAQPRVVALPSDAVERKREALAQYASQVPALDGGHAGLATNAVTLGYELFWADPAVGELLPNSTVSL